MCDGIRIIGIREIARRTGISPAMVSLFASGRSGLSGELADKIITMAKRANR